MLKINPEFQKLIPKLSPEEFNQLEQNIIADGCRDPIVLWDETIIDGHNRFEICQKYDLEFSTVHMDFNSEPEVKEWMILNQFGRRNLPNFVRAELALKLKPVLTEKAKERMLNPMKNSAQGSTRNELAEKAGVSHDTISRTEKILEKADEETKEKLRSGEMSINQAYNETCKNIHVSNNSGNNEWYTPIEFIESAIQVMGCIDLDPASSELANKMVCAEKFFTENDDGLKQSWFGNVWMNPPYAQPLMSRFAEKMAESIISGDVDQAIVLVNNATETAWFQVMTKECSAICFPSKRMKFIDTEGKSTGAPLQGQAILYFGSRFVEFNDIFSNHGIIVYHEIHG